MRFLPGRFRHCAYEKDVMGALWTVMLPVSVADICSHRRRCCSLCSMDKDAIIAVLFMDQGCPDTDGAALKVRAFGVRGGKERK